MSNYSQRSNFAIKDNLPINDPLRVVRGVELNEEFLAISEAVASKADSNSPFLTGNPRRATPEFGDSSDSIATTQFVSEAVSFAIPTGLISLWSGSIQSIPNGWFLCDGQNGTPDLRNRFVVGSGAVYGVGAVGGNKDSVVVSHNHSVSTTLNDPGHSHIYQDVYYAENFGNNQGSVGSNRTDFDNDPFAFQHIRSTSAAGTGISVFTSMSPAGESGIDKNLPPYYALAYIMKG